jgi:hypothetical protein
LIKMTVNKTSRRVWAYETTPRTSAIQNATDTTYDFGNYGDEAQKWTMGSMTNKALSYYIYNKITPELADGRRTFQTFHEIFNPTTPQWLVWILGKCTDASPDTIEPLDSGYQYPLTVRHEEGGGTETFEQMVSCWCVGAYGRAAHGSPFIVDLEFAFEQYQDHDDEPQLTTAPRSCGHTGVSNIYNGMPTVTYDPDGTPDIIDWAVKAEFKIANNYSAVLNGAETQQTVNKHTFEPVDLTITGISNENTFWDHYMDRTQQDWEVAIYKPNTSYYKKMKFVDAIPIKVIKEGEPFKGYFMSTIHLQAEEVTATFAWEGSDTWANHFKGEVV